MDRRIPMFEPLITRWKMMILFVNMDKPFVCRFSKYVMIDKLPSRSD